MPTAPPRIPVLVWAATGVTVIFFLLLLDLRIDQSQPRSWIKPVSTSPGWGNRELESLRTNEESKSEIARIHDVDSTVENQLNWDSSGETFADDNWTVYSNNGPNLNLKLDRNRQRDAPVSEMKYILMWDNAYGDKTYGFGLGREPFYTNLCPETRCITTQDRSSRAAGDFDAVVFHQRGMKWSDVPDPKTRKPHQRYIHFVAESPMYFASKSWIGSMDGFFNWTLTYRKDSDFFYPYGHIVQTKVHPKGEELEQYIKEFGRKNKHMIEGRNKSIAWFVSNCQSASKREDFVRKVKNHVEVDIYGGCGPFDCPRATTEECYKKIEKEYKFYLSFENSVCRDYVTEKLFFIMEYNIIPVTYNGVDMEALAPHHSYINALNFSSVTEFAQYIDTVSRDPELYASYFWWKDFYSIRPNPKDKVQGICDLCAALHADLPVKVYDNLYKWWVEDAHCRVPSVPD